jgi:NDP-sugar pyrophosphorylase family protein
MKKLTYLLVFITFLGLSSCGGSEVCNCIDLALEYSKESKTANGDIGKLKKIEERFKEDSAKCMNLGKGKTDAELKEMDKEAEKCPSYKELIRLR